jgi:hypothetical protein
MYYQRNPGPSSLTQCLNISHHIRDPSSVTTLGSIFFTTWKKVMYIFPKFEREVYSFGMVWTVYKYHTQPRKNVFHSTWWIRLPTSLTF